MPESMMSYVNVVLVLPLELLEDAKPALFLNLKSYQTAACPHASR
jgi:hypothetical protein